ncbi:hypothetical protein M758_2G055600 [Ceratodon purpureus]|nr:hypothetical protein M758_2G055600 [Ceratodon purpureus]
MADALAGQIHSTESVAYVTLLIDSANAEAVDLISAMCSWYPNERPTASEALQHPFFTNDKQRGPGR